MNYTKAEIEKLAGKAPDKWSRIAIRWTSGRWGGYSEISRNAWNMLESYSCSGRISEVTYRCDEYADTAWPVTSRPLRPSRSLDAGYRRGFGPQ